MPADNATALLQEQLLDLKQRHGKKVALRKNTSNEAAAPFPVTVSFKVARPEAAERYDVEGFTVEVKVVAEAVDTDVSIDSQAAGVSVNLTEGGLPEPLRQQVAVALYEHWRQQYVEAGCSGHLQLDSILQHAESHFLQLITALPKLVEAYGSVDASGASVRRFAVISTEEQVVAGCPPVSGQPADSESRAAGVGDSGDSLSQLGLDASAGKASLAAAHRALVHRPPVLKPQRVNLSASALEEEFVWLRRRYGAGVSSGPAPAAGPAGICAVDALSASTDSKQGATQRPSWLPGRLGTCWPPATPSAQGPTTTFALQLQPTDPSWEDGPLQLQCRVAASYPASGSLSVEVLEGSCNGGLEAREREALAKLIAAEAGALMGRRDALRQLLRWIENRAAHLVHLAADVHLQLRQSQQGSRPTGPQQGGAAASGTGGRSLGEAAAVEQGAPVSGADSSRSCTAEDSGSESSGSSGDWSSGEQDEGQAPGAGDQQLHSTGAAERRQGGLQVQLEGLQLDNVEVAEPYQLSLQVICKRCGNPGEVLKLDAGSSKQRPDTTAECSTCHAVWLIATQHQMVHAHSNVLAVLRVENCTPRDLLPSLLVGHCASCSSPSAFREVKVGGHAQRQCASCHTSLSIHFDSVNFVERNTAKARATQQTKPGPQSTAKRPEVAGHLDLLRVGGCLPANGTCKHYNHSYRWLRFPCCGSRFPCDLCHEEQTDGHEIKWATRMVCGFCSIEQPVSHRCYHCNKKVATGAAASGGHSSRFWEGGKGCRDRRRLDRNDPRKHRNSKLKTSSRKDERVGSEGARRRDERAKAKSLVIP